MSTAKRLQEQLDDLSALLTYRPGQLPSGRWAVGVGEHTLFVIDSSTDSVTLTEPDPWPPGITCTTQVTPHFLDAVLGASSSHFVATGFALRAIQVSSFEECNAFTSAFRRLRREPFHVPAPDQAKWSGNGQGCP